MNAVKQKPRWLHEPPTWNDSGERLTFSTAKGVDFWRNTLVGTIADNGHLYYNEVENDFTATVRVSGEYRDQYDQAGLFVRQDEFNWLKCGVENVIGKWADRYEYKGNANLVCASLTTNGWSEWSVLPQFRENPRHVWMRVIREGKTVFVDFSLDGSDYKLIKLFAFPKAKKLLVGRYATSPAGNGFEVTFDQYSLTMLEKQEAME
jgi:uncharacterized protein